MVTREDWSLDTSFPFIRLCDSVEHDGSNGNAERRAELRSSSNNELPMI